MTASSPDRPLPPSRSLPPPPAFDSRSTTALFLDFDGTLVDIAPHPDQIDVARDLPGLLAVLVERLKGRVAIVSGRSLADLDRHLGPLAITMVGSHGSEVRERGSTSIKAFAEGLPAGVLEDLRIFAAAHDGLLVEPKPFSVAIHFRDRPEAEDSVIARARSIAAAASLKLKHGKMVIELLMPGPDKGEAVAGLMQAAPFAGATPIFIGDDITDEDAFRKVRQFDGGGILVGQQRPTAALWRLGGIADVRDWLKAGLE